MKTRTIPLVAVLLLVLAGCSNRHDLTGKWGNGKVVAIYFREDGALLYGEESLVAMWRQQNDKLKVQVDGVWRAGPCLWIDNDHIDTEWGKLERMK